MYDELMIVACNVGIAFASMFVILAGVFLFLRVWKKMD